MKNQTSPAPLRGEKLAKATVNQILAEPQTWDQTNWHSSCGTKHCFAGWCQIMSGKPANSGSAQSDAAEALGLSVGEAEWFFRGSCSLTELHNLAANFGAGFNRAGFNRAGFDRAGFDRDGFNRDGLNRAGFNCDGFNRAGFNCDGFNCDGFNRAGFDRAGFDRAGFNRAGFDRDGCDRAGWDRDGKKLQPFAL